jgi:hypothetical protein
MLLVFGTSRNMEQGIIPLVVHYKTKSLHFTSRTRACVETYSQLHPSLWDVSDPEPGDLGKQVQRHVGNLGQVTLPVTPRDSTDHHVGVTNRLNL